jgi:hypothetical protein
MRGKSHRKEVAKKLQEQIAATTDPKLIIELSNQLSKFLPRPRQARRPRKAEVTPPSKNRSLREKYTGSVYEQMSDGDLVCWHLVFEIEKRQRMGFLTNRAERTAFKAEVLASLTDAERAAYEAFEREGVA